jgi:hypothetical protein
LHGNGYEALTRAKALTADIAALNTACPGLKRLIKQATGLATYITNNAASIVIYSRRSRNGEQISTAFVESTVSFVINRRFAKKQQMKWSKLGAYRLLQMRTRTLDGTLCKLFTRWYPDMAVNDNQVPALANAA